LPDATAPVRSLAYRRTGPVFERRRPGLGDEVDVDQVEVVAAVIERDGRILITRRGPGSHLEGLWEFPGGKPHPGESQADALRREIEEELGVSISVGEPIETVEWTYPDKRVRLVFFRCALEGEPRPLEGQEMAWVTPAELGRYQFPPADAQLLTRLQSTSRE
jgi:8-oxo-dGTP diphosphatase